MSLNLRDEHGVQGRFQQSSWPVMRQVLKAQSIDMHFADFKCQGSSYTNTPDMIPGAIDKRESLIYGSLPHALLATTRLTRHISKST